MLSAYLPPLCGVCLVRVKKNGSNGFIVPLACIAHPPRRMSDAGSGSRILRLYAGQFCCFFGREIYDSLFHS
jgi:hypothetical protein